MLFRSYGDPLACCTLQADNASCRICDAIGEEQFRTRSDGLACTQLFYGSKTRVAKPPSHPWSSRWLRVEDVVAIVDLGYHARGFASSVRTLTCLPRTRAKVDGCEARFVASWERVLEALRHVEVDTSGAFLIVMALRRSGLPPDICRQVLELVVPWPQFAGDGPVRKGMRQTARPRAARRT